MSREGPPVAPEKKEKEPITDEQCVDSMKQGNFELVKEWYAQQEMISSQDPSIKGHVNLTIKLSRLQFEAGLVDYARDTLEAAYDDVFHQRDDAACAQIREVLDNL